MPNTRVSAFLRDIIEKHFEEIREFLGYFTWLRTAEETRRLVIQRQEADELLSEVDSLAEREDLVEDLTVEESKGVSTRDLPSTVRNNAIAVIPEQYQAWYTAVVRQDTVTLRHLREIISPELIRYFEELHPELELAW